MKNSKSFGVGCTKERKQTTPEMKKKKKRQIYLIKNNGVKDFSK